jgi:RNA polymerase sigma-70 factor (ECF subfamily)
MGAKTDQHAELESFVVAKREALVRSAIRILHNPDEAEDVVQDALVAVSHRLDRCRIRRLHGYVFRAVRLNALKRLARRKMHLPLDTYDAATSDDAGDENDFEITPATLERAIRDLPEKQQAVIRMKYYVGLTFREIGKTLSVSANTAASRCRYALINLRKFLFDKKG